MNSSDLDQSRQHVGIIGGGLSGLATAVHVHLRDPGTRVSVLEARDRVGGVLHTEQVGDLLIDHGADMFATNPSAAIDLCRALGVEDRLIEPNETGRGAKIVHRGRLVPLPDGFVLMRASKLMPMLSTPLLSPAGKLRLAAESVIPPRQSDEDESVADFVRRRMGREVLERIIAPLVAGIYTADVERLSMQATMRPFLRMEQEHGSLAKATLRRRLSGEDSVERNSSGARYGQFRAFRGGMIELIQTLVNALPDDTVATGVRVHDLQRDDSKWRVSDMEGVTREFDQLVIAADASAAAKLLERVAPDASRELASIELASTAIAVLAVPRNAIAKPPETFGFVVPQREQRRILAASFASEKFSGRAPVDQVIARVFIGGSLQPELLRRSDAALIEIAREELADLIGLQGEPIHSQVVRWEHAMPQYHLGHLGRVRRIRGSLASVENLWLVSNALEGVGIAPVVESARKVAEQIVKRSEVASPPA